MRANAPEAVRRDRAAGGGRRGPVADQEGCRLCLSMPEAERNDYYANPERSPSLFPQSGNFLRRWILDFAPLSPNLLMEKDLLPETHKSSNFRLSDFLGTNFTVFDGQRPSLMLLRNQEAE